MFKIVEIFCKRIRKRIPNIFTENHNCIGFFHHYGLFMGIINKYDVRKDDMACDKRRKKKIKIEKIVK